MHQSIKVNKALQQVSEHKINWRAYPFEDTKQKKIAD